MKALILGVIRRSSSDQRAEFPVSCAHKDTSSTVSMAIGSLPGTRSATTLADIQPLFYMGPDYCGKQDNSVLTIQAMLTGRAQKRERPEAEVIPGYKETRS